MESPRQRQRSSKASLGSCLHEDSVRECHSRGWARTDFELYYKAARQAQAAASTHFDPDVIAKRTQRHLDELEVRLSAKSAHSQIELSC